MPHAFLRCSAQTSVSQCVSAISPTRKPAKQQTKGADILPRREGEEAEAATYLNLTWDGAGHRKQISLTSWSALHTGRALGPELQLAQGSLRGCSRQAFLGCEEGWDAVVGSAGLTRGCSTWSSSEVESTSLLPAPGASKALGWRGADGLQSPHVLSFHPGSLGSAFAAEHAEMGVSVLRIF